MATSGVVDLADAVQLSNATPQPIGTATAGTDSLASRDDHVHAIGSGTIPLTALAPQAAFTTVANNTAGSATPTAVSVADMQTMLAVLPLAGGALSGALNEAAGATIPSATTTDIGAATGNYVVVSGVTTITGLGTIQAGTRRIVKFSGALLLTYNASSLILPGAANIKTVAGDVATFVSLASGNWICVEYTTFIRSGSGAQVFGTSPTLTTPNIGAATGASLALTSKIGTYNNVATVENGVPASIVSASSPANAGDISAQQMVASAAAGRYRLSGVATVTQQASSSATLPRISMIYTDAVDSVQKTIQIAPAFLIAGGLGNPTTGNGTTGVGIMNVKAGTAISYNTGGTGGAYASVGTTAMQYDLYLVLEAM